MHLPKLQIFVEIFCANLQSPVWNYHVGVPPWYTNRVLKCDVTKKQIWEIMGFGAIFELSVLKRRVLAKNYLLIVIPSRNMKDENLVLPHINLSNFESVLNWRNWNKIWRACMACYQTLIPYISIGNCNLELIFGMRTSIRFLYKKYDIISHNFKNFIFVMSSL